jgi:SLA1 homology domain 1, SHD1
MDADLLRLLRVDGVENKGSRIRSTGLSSSSPESYFVLRSGTLRDDVCIRAAANGQAYGLWSASRSSSGLESLLIGDAVVRDHYESDSAGHVVPMADGSAICTAIGYYTSDLARKRGSDINLPTTHPDYAITLVSAGGASASTTTAASPPAAPASPAPTSRAFPPAPTPYPPPRFGAMPPGLVPPGYVPPGVAPPGYVPPGVAPPGYAPPGYAPPGAAPPGAAADVQSPFASPPAPTSSSKSSKTAKQALPRQGTLIDGRGRTVAQLPEMAEMDGPLPSDGQKGLTLDQRYLCLPQAKLLITIPSSNDKLVFHTLDIDPAPYDAVDPREDDGTGGAVASASASAPQLRTWNDKSGKFSIVATFQSFEGGQVKLKKEDGAVVAVPLEKLSEGDAEYVRTQIKK